LHIFYQSFSSFGDMDQTLSSTKNTPFILLIRMLFNDASLTAQVFVE